MPDPDTTATRTGRAGPTGPQDPDAEAWRLPRHLTAIAVAIVAALVVGGWALHAWGPLNPGVDVQASLTAADQAWARLEVRVRNTSASPLTVEGVVVTEPGPAPTRIVDGQEVTTGPPAIAAEPLAGSPLLGEDGRARPLALAAGEEVVLPFEVTVLPCTGASGMAGVAVAVRTTSDWGTEHVHDAAPILGTTLFCPPPLPPENAVPADRAAAEADIGTAYATAYDAGAPAPERAASVEDPGAVEDLAAAAQAGPYAEAVAATTATVTEVSFDGPGHAWVRYDLDVPTLPLGPRLGEAVVVDGRWVVARATVCEDLALAGAPCPPVPG